MKKLLFALLLVTGVTRLVAWVNRFRVPILCYHSVTRRQGSAPNDPFKLHLPLKLFVKQLDYLQANYSVIALSDFIRAHRAKTPLPSNSVVLTFDDGFRNFTTTVVRELVAREMPATVFVVTDKTEQSDNSARSGKWHPKDDETFLSWEEIDKLTKMGIEVGSHSCSHSRLLSLSPEAAVRELEVSKAVLSDRLSQDSFPLSYPHGQTSEDLSRLAESVGYYCALTTDLGRNGKTADLFALRRTVVAANDDVPTFAARVSGITWWSGKLLGLFTKADSNEITGQIGQYEPLARNVD